MAFNGVASRKKSCEHIGLYVWSSLLGLLIIGALGALTRLPFFYFKRIEIAGETRVPKEEIIAELMSYPLKGPVSRFLGFNHFLLWSAPEVALADARFARVAISRDLIHRTLRATVSDRAQRIVWCVDSVHCVWADDDGIAFQNAPFAEGQLVRAVTAETDEPLIFGRGVLPGEEFRRVREIFNIIDSAALPVAKTMLERASGDLRIALVSGAELYFNVRIDPSFAVTALRALVSRKDFVNIAYADFRVARKVYYKMRGAH